MCNLKSNPLTLSLLLSAPLFASANGTSAQNSCGSSWADAVTCGTRCPTGTDAECPGGKTCYADVPCPLPPTISPKPTRQPVRGFQAGNQDKAIIGYYASWQWYDRAKVAKPENMDFSKVTRVNFAFFQLDVEGNIWGTDEWADPRLLFGDVRGDSAGCTPSLLGNCKCHRHTATGKMCQEHDQSNGLIWLAHQARAEIYPSIGGWTLSDPFSAMSANSANRAAFARNCRRLIEEYDFDGIDLDWEYPGYASHSGTPEDTKNFSLLLRDIRMELNELGAQMNRFYGLTAALPCGPSNIKNIDIGTAAQHLTEFNLMSYDFHGSWDANTGVNSPLYDQSSDPEPGWSVDGCVKNWESRGAPKDKLNIGLAFYGRSFRGAKEMGVTHKGTDDSNWNVDEGTPQYFNIMEQIDSLTVHWHKETSTPYAFFNDGGLVSFDDERAICLKTEYVINESLHGFIIWELSGDMMEDLYTPLLNIINRKLSVTDTNCADPFGPTLPSVVPIPLATTVPDTNTGATATITASTATATATTATTTEAITTSTNRATTTTEAATTTSTTTVTEEEPTTSTTTTATTTTTNREEPTTTTATSSSTSSTAAATTQTAAKIEAAMSSFTPAVDSSGRKRVKREDRKPSKPYRPPKAIQEL